MLVDIIESLRERPAAQTTTHTTDADDKKEPVVIEKVVEKIIERAPSE